MPMSTIDDLWKAFRAQLPASMTPLEVQRARLTWYAGASTVFDLMVIGLGSPSVSSEDAERYLTRCQEEFSAFADTAVGELLSSANGLPHA